MSFDIEAPIHSESVALLCASPDAREGFNLRLCRYPSAGVAWLWVVTFIDGKVTVHTDHLVPCANEITDSEREHVSYEAGRPVASRFRREGSSQTMTKASAYLELPEGAPPMVVEASFLPRHFAGGTLPGRSEVFGRARASVEMDGRTLVLEGLAQWHEQHQETPRFRAPFVYASLRGPDSCLVALAGRERSGGILVTESTVTRVAAADLSADLRILTDDGTEFEGKVDTTYSYTLPLYGKLWHGRQVRAELGPHVLSGSINDWSP